MARITPNWPDPSQPNIPSGGTYLSPRRLPCPTCGAPNKMTPKDISMGYQCNDCADTVK